MMISDLYPRILCDDGTSAGAASGGSPAPAPTSPPGEAGAGAESTPQQIPSSIQEDTSAPSTGQEFEGMEDDFDSIDLGLPPTDDGSGGRQAPQAPTAQQPATPAAQAAPQVAAPQGQQAGNVSSAQRSQLDTALEGFKSNYADLATWASQNLFALSKEDAEGLETNPVEMIPKLMGRIYVSSLQAATNLIKNFVPEMVQSGVGTQQQRAAKASEALNEFYASNPHLNAQQHGAAVDKWARAFRAANPQASRSEAIAFVGRAVSAEFGSAGMPAQRAAPFAPARPGARAPMVPQGAHDPYAGMEDDLD